LHKNAGLVRAAVAAGFIWAAVLEQSPHKRLAAAAEKEGSLHILGRSGIREGVQPTQALNMACGDGMSMTPASIYRANVVAVDLAGLWHYDLRPNPAHNLCDATGKRPHRVGEACALAADR